MWINWLNVVHLLWPNDPKVQLARVKRAQEFKCNSKASNELFVPPLHKHRPARDSIAEVITPPKYFL